MWDTAGAGQYQSLDVTFYGGADVCILVFDVTKPEKFESISQYKDEFLTQVCVSYIILYYIHLMYGVPGKPNGP